MEQALKVLSTSKSMFRPRRRNSAKKDGSSVETKDHEAMPTALFPLSELLEQLLRQEAELWTKNECLRSAIKLGGKGHTDQENGETTLRGGGVTLTPTPSLTTSPPHTPTPTPPLSSHPPNAHDTTDETRDQTLCLVQYGRLTNDIHRYFRRLEKRHACLYLTKRRAKHENLRHVETQVRSQPHDPHGPEVQSAGYLLHEGGGEDGQLVTLRDEELLVFRAALMCAQFPMLSAPSPPEGASPTPTPPTVPFSTIGSPDVGDLSRTAPPDVYENHLIMRQSAGSPQGGKSSPRVRRSVSDRVRMRGNPLRSPNNGSRGVVPTELDGETEEDSKDLISEPISIRGRTKSGLRRTASTHSSSSSSRKLAKRLSIDAANMLPAMDSDGDDELAELSRPRSLRSRDSAHLVGREHPFSPMVNREMLCSLVRRAFKQTEEQQLQFEQMLKHEYGRRSKGEILAKELAGQLQVLENNAHPFYKPKFFVTRNIGYDQWLQAEKQRVRSLIDKFWHFSLPRPQLWRHYNPTDYHRAYSLLLTRIICCESRTERREPVHAGKTPSSPLSPTAQRLLNEFGLRYGVGELYCKIVYLDYLARHFDYEVWYIRHCTEELRAIRDLLPRNRNKITAVRKEMDLLKTTVHLLHGQTDNCLTKIDRLFQDSPTEGVASLIELLAEVLDAEMSLFGKRILSVEEWLKRYLKRGFALRYERRKEIHADETMNSRTAKPFVPTPALVNALLLSIKDEVKDYRDKFQPVFRRYFDIVPFARMEFYRLMCSDACSLCLRTIHKPETRVRLNLEMLGLLYRLNERDNEWENVIPPDMQQWRHSFVDLSLIWMEVLGKQINKWVLQSVSRDKWTLLTFSSSAGAVIGETTNPIHSMGVRAGVSSSPFPSPGYTPVPNTPHSFVGSIGSNGAFTPYRKSAERGRQRNPPESASSSSSRLLSPTDNAVKAVAEIPDLVMRGAHRGTPSRASPQDNIMRFWQIGSGLSNHRDALEDSSTIEPSQDIEVSVSVYGSRDASPDLSPEVVRRTTSNERTLNEQPSDVKDERGPELEDVSPPPLPSPLVEECEPTHNAGDGTQRGGGNVAVGGGDSSQVEHTMEVKGEKGEGKGGSDRLLFSSIPGVAINGVVKGYHLQNDTTGSSTVSGTVSKEGKDTEHSQYTSQAHHRRQEDDKPNRSPHSDYHTPSPISEDELQQLSRSELVRCQTEETDAAAGRQDEGGSERNIDSVTAAGEEQVDGRAFKPHDFSSADSPLVHFVEKEGSLVRPKPHPSNKPLATHDIGRHETNAHATPRLVVPATTEPAALLGDISVASSAASSFHDTYLQKEYSSLDRHSDMEESVIQVGGREREKGRGVGRRCDDAGGDVGLQWKVDQMLKKDRSYLFPISNSPMDIVTMLTRLACFTSTLLTTLTPTLRHGAVPGLDEPKRVHDYAPDVAMAKKQASQQLKHVKNTHTEFLKKLHKIMYNSLRLYADNLICMDLCCCSSSEALELLGSEMLHHLQRRRDTKEIWGCRHMVEVRHGLHPNGLPCRRRKSVKFESITRDMCLRINNIHLLISIFPSFESHLLSITRKELRRPATAFGYISSDVGGDPLGLQHGTRTHTTSQYGAGSAPQSQVDRDLPGSLVTSSDHSLMPRGSSLSWGYPNSRERDRAPPEKPETGFASRDSEQLLEYLRKIQKVQLKLLCSRMNKFFQPALSLLLELRLGESGIERRLHPLITFLTRHRSALQKYIYPECFHTLMNYLWGFILQDLEEEAVKLRESKKPVTSRAQMLLQALSHLMGFVHNKTEGVPLQTLTPSCEYLLALLDVMTRSTDQLITIFNKLSAPQFAMSRLDLTRAPVPVDSAVVHTLRSQLHTFKKCFSGKEFVEQFLKLGREAETLRLNSSEPNTPSPLITTQHSPGLGGYNSTGAKIMYTVHYTKEVGQFLLSERVLLPLPNLRQEPSEYDSDEAAEDRAISSGRLQGSSSIQTDQQQVRVVGGGRGEGEGSEGGGGGTAVGDHSKNKGPSVENSPQPPHSRTSVHTYKADLQEDASTPQLVNDMFVYSPQSLYKFSDVEDFESRALYHSQILSASAHSQAASSLEETTAFEKARLGMLYLVQDLLLQRTRKEKRVKQFLQTPRAVTVAERRKRQFVDCNLIFKM